MTLAFCYFSRFHGMVKGLTWGDLPHLESQLADIGFYKCALQKWSCLGPKRQGLSQRKFSHSLCRHISESKASPSLEGTRDRVVWRPRSRSGYPNPQTRCKSQDEHQHHRSDWLQCQRLLPHEWGFHPCRAVEVSSLYLELSWLALCLGNLLKDMLATGRPYW